MLLQRLLARLEWNPGPADTTANIEQLPQHQYCTLLLWAAPKFLLAEPKQDAND